jgi:hypothetical protein
MEEKMDKKFLISLFIIVGLLVGLVISFNSINDLKTAIKIDRTNMLALNDTLKSYKIKNGTLVTEKQSLYSSINDLKNVNKQLYDSVTYYQKALKIKINTIQTVNVNARIDTKYDSIKINKEKTSDSTVGLSLKATEKDGIITSDINADLSIYYGCDSLKVLNSILSSTVKVEGLSLNIITGYRKHGIFKPSVQYISLVTTNDDRFKVSKIDSWINKDFEKKRYLSLKPGIFAGGFYDPIYKHFSLGIGFGLTVQYIK